MAKNGRVGQTEGKTWGKGRKMRWARVVNFMPATVCFTRAVSQKPLCQPYETRTVPILQKQQQPESSYVTCPVIQSIGRRAVIGAQSFHSKPLSSAHSVFETTPGTSRSLASGWKTAHSPRSSSLSHLPADESFFLASEEKSLNSWVTVCSE